ncbi:MAG: hypothetical protein HZB36_00360 [Candidatus Omnitrophica bacterium]|nr:hypothetical protein [Candidatus Omnitrophota bacterium]
MGRFNFKIAQDSDDCAIREVFHDTPMDGKIGVAFKREPSYFTATKVGNEFHQTIIATDEKTNDIVGLGSRSIKPCYINGEVANIGYLSSLRIKNDYRNNILLARGYEYLHKLHQDKKASIYITSIIEDNNYAIGLLTSKRAGLPRYLDMGLYCTTAIGLSRKKHDISGNIKVVKGSYKNIDAIVEYLNRNGKNKQFYPYYTRESFLSNNGILKDFQIDNFYIALRNNNVVGTIATWYQGNFKQTIITGYNGLLRFIKPFYNLGATVIGLPKLPRSNTQLKFLYTGFIAIDSNDMEIFRALLRTIYNDAVNSNYDYLLVGLHESDPLLRAIKEDYRFIKYSSRVFVVCWDDGVDLFNKLDNRIPYLELATL